MICCPVYKALEYKCTYKNRDTRQLWRLGDDIIMYIKLREFKTQKAFGACYEKHKLIHTDDTLSPVDKHLKYECIHKKC